MATDAAAGPRILVVRLGAMGDVVHALPAVAALKAAHNGSHITWVVEPKWRALLEGNASVDRIFPFRRKPLREALAGIRELRRERYDFAVDFQGLIKSAVVAYAARPPRVYGFDGSLAREPFAAHFYTDRILTSAAHVVDKNLDLAAATGALTTAPRFELPRGHAEGPLPEGPYVLASPFAGWTSKQWPLSHYAALATLLRNKLNVPLVLDGPTPEALAAVPNAYPHVSTIAGLIYATRCAAAVVGVDSGPMHIAAALGRPGVAIFGPTDPARNGPYGGSMAVLRSKSATTTYKRGSTIDPSMRAITPEQVFECLREVLAPGVSPTGLMAG